MEFDAALYARDLGAYGSCEEAPQHFAALLTDDIDAHEEALNYLDDAVLFDRTPLPVTPRATKDVLRLLGDPRTKDVRVELLTFLAYIGEACTQFEADKRELRSIINDANADLDASIKVALDGGEPAIRALFNNENLFQALTARAMLELIELSDEMIDVARAFLNDEETEVRKAAEYATEELTELRAQYR